jgi:hypothetical protein
MYGRYEKDVKLSAEDFKQLFGLKKKPLMLWLRFCVLLIWRSISGGQACQVVFGRLTLYEFKILVAIR